MQWLPKFICDTEIWYWEHADALCTRGNKSSDSFLPCYSCIHQNGYQAWNSPFSSCTVVVCRQIAFYNHILVKIEYVHKNMRTCRWVGDVAELRICSVNRRKHGLANRFSILCETQLLHSHTLHSDVCYCVLKIQLFGKNYFIY